MSLDLSQDDDLIDDPVTVQYRAKTGEGAWADPEVVCRCQVNAVTKDDLARNPALLLKQAAVFHLWTRRLGLIVPKAGDRLQQDPGESTPDVTPLVWVVESVTAADRDRNGPQRYRLVVVRSTGVQTL